MKVVIADKYPVFGHAFAGLAIHVVGKQDGILLNTSRHRHSEKSRVEVVHVRNRRLSLVERAPIVNDFPSALWSRSHGVRRRMDPFLWGKYELSSSRSGILGLRGPTLASLIENDGAATTSNEASATTPSALGDPPAGIPSSADAQDSLEASWGEPSKAN